MAKPFIMKGIIIFTFSLALSLLVAQGQTKLMTPGEHLIYSFESFDDKNEPFEVTVRPGEAWTAVYVQDGEFQTRAEIINWDTTKGFQILSDTTRQPKFFIQGLPHVSGHGPGTEFRLEEFYAFRPLTWTLYGNNYTLLYSDDLNCEKLTSKKYGEIECEQQLAIFKNVDGDELVSMRLKEENIVKLFWTGDLNGDQEPDFLIALPSHHETLILELVVSVTENRRTRWKSVARFSESS